MILSRSWKRWTAILYEFHCIFRSKILDSNSPFTYPSETSSEFEHATKQLIQMLPKFFAKTMYTCGEPTNVCCLRAPNHTSNIMYSTKLNGKQSVISESELPEYEKNLNIFRSPTTPLGRLSCCENFFQTSRFRIVVNFQLLKGILKVFVVIHYSF